MTFQGKLVDSELEKHKSLFDADKKAFVITCMKENAGEEFPGLDLLTSLLTPKGATNIHKPGIEVVEGNINQTHYLILSTKPIIISSFFKKMFLNCFLPCILYTSINVQTKKKLFYLLKKISKKL